MRVLIVEDEELIRTAYEMILNHSKSNEYEVYTASNGIEALKEIQAIKPHVVLLDVFMPIMDGMTLLKNLDLSEYPNTSIIACTNLSDPTTKSEMLRLGCIDVVLKSDLDPGSLVELVESAQEEDKKTNN